MVSEVLPFAQDDRAALRTTLFFKEIEWLMS
jgi:hypothetical protein